MPELLCPVCGAPLRREDRAWRCENRHCFDVARSGYVNLLPPSPAGRRHGDDRRMVDARTAFLSRGYYAHLEQAVAALYVISSILGLSAVMLTSSGAIKAMLFLMALAVAAFLASRVIFRRDIDKALQAEKAAAEEKSTETATPAETVPAEPEEESNEKKKEEA